MTRDPAAQAVHERLEHAVTSMPAFDVDAGWSALAAQLEPPIASVIPLRRRRPRKMLALGAAAALLVGGSALAALRNGGAPAVSVSPQVFGPGSGLVVGPHSHPAFSGPPQAGPGVGSFERSGGAAAGDTGGPQGSGGSSGPSGSGGSGGPNQDSPDDIDHGSGNDGQHDDNGGGNDTTGQEPGHQGSRGAGHSQGSDHASPRSDQGQDQASGDHGPGSHGPTAR